MLRSRLINDIIIMHALKFYYDGNYNSDRNRLAVSIQQHYVPKDMIDNYNNNVIVINENIINEYLRYLGKGDITYIGYDDDLILISDDRNCYTYNFQEYCKFMSIDNVVNNVINLVNDIIINKNIMVTSIDVLNTSIIIQESCDKFVKIVFEQGFRYPVMIDHIM